jgi:hypothetical protein
MRLLEARGTALPLLLALLCRAPAGAQPDAPVLGPVFDLWDVDTYRDSSPDVAWNEEHGEFLVVFRVHQDLWSSDIWGCRVAIGGTVAHPIVTIASAADANCSYGDLAYALGEDSYLVAFERLGPPAGTVRSRRVTGDLATLGTSETLGSGEGGPFPSVDFGFGEYLVAWREGGIHARRVAVNGEPQGTGAFPVTEVVPPGYMGYPVVVTSWAYGFLIYVDAYSSPEPETGDVVGRWIAPGSGEPGGPLFPLHEAPGPQWGPRLACAEGSICLLADVRKPSPWPAPDIEISARFVHPTLFADGFEAGDSSAWSQAVPRARLRVVSVSLPDLRARTRTLELREPAEVALAPELVLAECRAPPEQVFGSAVLLPDLCGVAELVAQQRALLVLRPPPHEPRPVGEQRLVDDLHAAALGALGRSLGGHVGLRRRRMETQGIPRYESWPYPGRIQP